jgi:hypothetical protein
VISRYGRGPKTPTLADHRNDAGYRISHCKPKVESPPVRNWAL